MYKKLRLLTTMLLLAVCCGTWAQTASVGDKLWMEEFKGGSSSTTFSATSNWNSSLHTTMLNSDDANSLTYASSNAMANNGTANYMNGAHVWLNKYTIGYISVSGIPLYNASKVKISWAQAGSSEVSVSYAFDGETTFTELSSNSLAAQEFMSDELIVEGHTTINLKFQRTSTKTNVRIDNLKLQVTEVISSELTASDLKLANAPVSLNFDLFNNSSAQTISYTTSSTGDVTVSGGEGYVTTSVDATNKTITVTPKAVTPNAQTITVSQAAADDYNAGTATFTVSVTNSDPNVPGTQNNPYTVAQAIDATPSTGSTGNVYIHGIVSSFHNTSIVGDGNNYRYYISDDGSTNTQLLVYKGKDKNQNAFDDVNDLLVGDEVIIYGKLITYNNAPEVAADNYIVFQFRKELNYITLSGNYRTTFVEGSEFSHEGIIVTAHYNDDSTMDVTENAAFSEPDMTQIGEQDVTVSFNGKSVNYTITITEAPSHTATFSVNGETYSASPFKEGVAIVFPSDAEAPEGYSIVGWLAEEMSEPQDEAPANIINSAVMGNADVTYYAVLAVVTPGTATTTTDVLNRETTGVEGSTYTEWSGKTDESGAVYAGQSAGENESIQLRSKNSNSGIVTTTSGGNAKKVTVEWNSNTESGRTLDIYGKETAYEAATDLYSTDSKGTKLGSIVCGTSTELTISGDYPYIGLRSNSGAMYLTSISIDWQTGTPDTYSNYCTTIPVHVSISAAGYATYVAADNVSFPEGVTAYIVSEVTESSIKLTEVLAVEKDVPVVVKATAGTYNLEVVTADDCDDDVSGNLLRVSDGNVKDNILVLANKNNGVGFYRWAGDNLPAGKVYLENPNSSREFFGFDEGVATSISTIDNGQLTMENAYNLQGQKVGSEYKGIVIVNGKKFINK